MATVPNYRLDGNNVVSFFVGNETEAAFDDLYISKRDSRVNSLVMEGTGFKLENLGSNVNSPFTEMIPLVSYDGRKLYISRLDHPENLGGDSNAGDIWASSWNGVDWGPVKNMGAPLNQPIDGNTNFVISVTPDNNTMYLRGFYNNEFSPVYVSDRSGDSWSQPQAVQFEKPVEFKGDTVLVNICTSPDRKTMILSIPRWDSKGGRDMYISHLNRNTGIWSEPKNMESLNTPGDDISPFIAADDVTLFYSSDGLPGYGGQDVFMTRRLDDTWENWSTPVNLGPDINKGGDEIDFTIPGNGEYAYLTSTTLLEGAKGGYDIYRVQVPEENKPEPVVLVYGNVYNSKTNDPLGATIDYNNLMDGRNVGFAKSDSVTGYYQIALPVGEYYSFFAQKDGFWPVSDNLDLTDVGDYAEIRRDLYLTPLEAGQVLTLNNVFFEFDKSDLQPTSYWELNRLVNVLKSNPDLKVEVGGHTDWIASKQYNIGLSQRRMNSVAAYLKKSGVKESSFTTKGYGEDYPIATNKTDIGRQLNRRVQVTILGPGVSSYDDIYTGVVYNREGNPSTEIKTEGIKELVYDYIADEMATYDQSNSTNNRSVTRSERANQFEMARRKAVAYYSDQLITPSEGTFSYDRNAGEVVIDIEGVVPVRIPMSRGKSNRFLRDWPNNISGTPIYDFNEQEKAFEVARMEVMIGNKPYVVDNFDDIIRYYDSVGQNERARMMEDLRRGNTGM